MLVLGITGISKFSRAFGTFARSGPAIPVGRLLMGKAGYLRRSRLGQRVERLLRGVIPILQVAPLEACPCPQGVNLGARPALYKDRRNVGVLTLNLETEIT